VIRPAEAAFLFKWSISSRDRIDRSGLKGLLRGKRTVRITAYMLFHSPAKDLRYAVVTHVNRQRATTLQISASSNANQIYLSQNKIIHEQQTEI